MPHAAEREEPRDDEAQEESGTPGFRKRGRGMNLMESEWSTLRNAYIENPYPSRCELTALAEKLDKPRDKVYRWFEHQRHRQRRLETEQEEQSDDETKGEGGTPGSWKRERGPKLRARNYGKHRFTDSERSTLRNAYIENPYPSQCELNALAEKLDRPRGKVKNWFDHERLRQRRLETEQDEQSDDETEGDGTPGSRKRERGPKLRDHNYWKATDTERSTLRKAFIENPYPSLCDYNALAEKLDKPRDKVKNWFDRQRRRKGRLETEQEEQSDDEAQGEGGTPGSRKRERGPKLRDRNYGIFTDSERTTRRNSSMENPYPYRCELNAPADEVDKPRDRVYKWFDRQRQRQRQSQRRLETEQEEQSDDETQGEGGTPGSRKRERGLNLRDRNYGKFTDSERSTLRSAFIENPYPSRCELNALAEKADKPRDNVKNWFHHQRQRRRRLETEQEEQSGDEPHEESAPVTQELGLECATLQYSAGRESPGLAASEVSPASAEVGVIPRIPDGFQLFGIGSAIFTCHSMAQEHSLQEAALACMIFDVRTGL